MENLSRRDLGHFLATIAGLVDACEEVTCLAFALAQSSELDSSNSDRISERVAIARLHLLSTLTQFARSGRPTWGHGQRLELSLDGQLVENRLARLYAAPVSLGSVTASCFAGLAVELSAVTFHGLDSIWSVKYGKPLDYLNAYLSPELTSHDAQAFCDLLDAWGVVSREATLLPEVSKPFAWLKAGLQQESAKAISEIPKSLGLFHVEGPEFLSEEWDQEVMDSIQRTEDAYESGKLDYEWVAQAASDFAGNLFRDVHLPFEQIRFARSVWMLAASLLPDSDFYRFNDEAEADAWAVKVSAAAPGELQGPIGVLSDILRAIDRRLGWRCWYDFSGYVWFGGGVLGFDASSISEHFSAFHSYASDATPLGLLHFDDRKQWSESAGDAGFAIKQFLRASGETKACRRTLETSRPSKKRANRNDCEARAWGFVAEFSKRHGRRPTVRELASALGCSEGMATTLDAFKAGLKVDQQAAAERADLLEDLLGYERAHERS